jgi:hypothetical protein
MLRVSAVVRAELDAIKQGREEAAGRRVTYTEVLENLIEDSRKLAHMHTRAEHTADTPPDLAGHTSGMHQREQP